MKSDPTDKVFKALADPNRRRILDLVKARPGIHVGELAEAFALTRYGVMKHLKVLEDAEVIVPRRNGRVKELYLNAIPIQTIYDRWISQYSARWASGLTSLKYQLEEEAPMASDKPRQVYVLYIRTSPAKLWDAITKPEWTRRYFFNTEVQSDFQAGSALEYFAKGEGGEKNSALTGKIVEVEPQKRLVHTFSFPGREDPPSLVTYELEPMGDVTQLRVTHEFDSETSTFKDTGEGWPRIFSALKTLLETGEELPVKF